MKVIPLGKRVLVKQVEAKEMSAGGIVLPGSAADADRPTQAKVIAVGTGVEEALKVGVLIIYGKYDGHDIEIDREEYIIIMAENILAVIEGEVSK